MRRRSDRSVLRERGRVHYAWVVAAVGFVALVMAAGFRSTAGVLLIPLHQEFGWSYETIGLAVSLNLLEVFGPVAAVIPFADEEEAVRLANDTPYGFSGSIWTRDGARALRVARALDAGVLSVNSNSSVRVSTPFGGFKQSGFGRELGMHALEGYSEVKNVFLSTEQS